MTKYVALLRGVMPTNPNMKSDKLKAFFNELGFNNVQTVITSGNVIFESSENNVALLETRIEEALPIKLGFTSSTIVRSKDILKSLADSKPYKELDHGKQSYLLVTFFKQKPNIPFNIPYQPKDKPFKIIGSKDDAIFGVVDLSIGRTPDYMAWLEKQFGKELSSRTWNTLERIVSKMVQ
jgi:uncharacterized protein (DUF1697 family)